MSKYSADEVRREYDAAADSELEHEKLKWGSRESMYNRFDLVLRELPFAEAGLWLDVGCGTGALLELVLERYSRIEARGIDLSEKLLEYARKRLLEKNIDSQRFTLSCIDFANYSEQSVDVFTALGVIHKTTLALDSFFQKVFESLRPGGVAFVDTKNMDWSRFEEPGFDPEPGHRWFRQRELIEAAEGAGLRLKKLHGFVPAENSLVEPEESHTIFLLLERPL